ncbi:MAG: hypothetical protein IJX47_09495 [Clostridia bacterium]|nr:hypothetical protein [Clostridia bacterium]
MTRLFNTPFELSLRSALLLSVVERKDMTLDRIAAYDFIAIYGSYFDLTENNLHGLNDYSFSEFTSRREVLSEALKSLVLDGLVRATHRKAGFCFEITEHGRAFCNKQSTEYASAYREMASKTNQKFGNSTEIGLLAIISEKAKESLRR